VNHEWMVAAGLIVVLNGAPRAGKSSMHIPGVHDLEVDISLNTTAEIAVVINGRLDAGPPTAFRRIASFGA
jgi:chloramphenicol 3-O-phosphotransferase